MRATRDVSENTIHVISDLFNVKSFIAHQTKESIIQLGLGIKKFIKHNRKNEIDCVTIMFVSVFIYFILSNTDVILVGLP